MNMDGGEGWRFMRCAGGVKDKTMINTLMLRFRPIAPKPAVGGPLPGQSPTFKDSAIVSTPRAKRKYVRVRRGCKESVKGSRGRAVAEEEPKSRSATTLQLLDENRVQQKVSSRGGARCSASTSVSSHTVTVTDKEDQDASNPSIRLNLNTMNDRKEALGHMAVVFPPRRKTVETLVTVEYVNETCMDALGFGRTDMEKITNLGWDTCPGFVSDGSNRVVWVNRAFRKMMMSLNREEEETPEMEVRLVMKEPLTSYNAFTCQVKVQYTWWKEKFSQMFPCDAWRMDGGGFAWRLDVKAALSLGRSKLY